MSCKTIQNINHSINDFTSESTFHNISNQNEIEFLPNNQMIYQQIAYHQILNQIEQQLSNYLKINYDDYYEQEIANKFHKEYQSFSNFDNCIEFDNVFDVENNEQEDEEEEFSVWGEDNFDKLGINTDNLRDCRGNQLEFYQLYRLRSVLYQPCYVSRFETIKEVLFLSQYFGKKISANQLKQQQIYLDNHFLIQKKDEHNKSKSESQTYSEC